eukprot:TRINITY_DN25561_c0_g2_i1.p1 TRINITY_DN25561_c0_g2~~TRINITY_DN25561_c0_g2_i1.p1  ORF type:complete len:481 (+),score=99.07 TRINITY_DN25561_c0_g2_i1:396-1838(+)
MSPLLGWMESCTVDATLTSWPLPAFDDSHWTTPVSVSTISSPVPLPARSATSHAGPLTLTDKGVLWERFGYADDDPAARFLLRSLKPPNTTDPALGDPQGVWWRFDALRAQLLRPVFVITAPAGSIVEICYCQSLVDGKASPFHPLTGGRSCYVDRYTVDSTVQNQRLTLTPLEPRGCRYMELHVLSDEYTVDLSHVQLVSASALYRCYDSYHQPPSGGLASQDRPALARIWSTGADSTRSCTEDVCIDGPCRERGQWLGDSAAVTLPNLVYMYDDLGPAKLLLEQTAAAADANGVFSGNCPESGGIADYALLWFGGLDLYTKSSGDVQTCQQLFGPAAKCMDYFLGPSCYKPEAGFAPPGLGLVIDWGYVDNGAFGVNMCLNALLISALTSMVSVATILQETQSASKYGAALASHLGLVRRMIGLGDEDLQGGWVVVQSVDFEKIGFHAAGLLLAAGVFEDALESSCADFLVAPEGREG